MKRMAEDRQLFDYLVKRGEIAEHDVERIRARRADLYPTEEGGLVAAAVDVGALEFGKLVSTYESIAVQSIACPGCGMFFPRKKLSGLSKFRCKACKTVIEVPERAPSVHVLDVSGTPDAGVSADPAPPPAEPVPVADLEGLPASLGLSAEQLRWVEETRRALDRRGEPVPVESILLASGLIHEGALAEALRRTTGADVHVVAVDPVEFRRPDVARRGVKRPQTRGVPRRTFTYQPPAPTPAPAPPVPVPVAAPPPAPTPAASPVAPAPVAAIPVVTAPVAPPAPVEALASPGPAVSELEALLASDVVDLSGRTIEEPISLSGRKLKELRLKGTVFRAPVDFAGMRVVEKVEARGAVFEGKADFKEADLQGGADFAECRFGAEAAFNSTRFAHYATFREAEFSAPARFTRAHFPRGVKFDRANFQADLSLNDIKVGHRFEMKDTNVRGGTTLSGAVFEDLAHFKSCRFEGAVKSIGTQYEKEVRVDECRYGSDLVYVQSVFDGDLKLIRPTFAGSVDLKEVHVTKSVQIRFAEYEPNANFVISGAHVGRFEARRLDFEGRMRNHREGRYAEARAEYGFLKTCLREINEYDDEDWAYRMEKTMARKAIPLELRRPGAAIRRFFDWLALDRACGYGTKPFNVFVSAISMIAFFAVIFAVFGRADPEQALLYSFKSFAGAEIDSWSPGTGAFLTYVAAIESFLGIFVVTVLVVTFSRKVIR